VTRKLSVSLCVFRPFTVTKEHFDYMNVRTKEFRGECGVDLFDESAGRSAVPRGPRRGQA
jgi:hypothetical protein